MSANLTYTVEPLRGSADAWSAYATDGWRRVCLAYNVTRAQADEAVAGEKQAIGSGWSVWEEED